MKTSDKVDVIFPLIFKVKKDLKSVAKTSNNPYFKSKYADLNSHIDAVEDLLEANDLVLSQPTVGDSTGNYVETRITHAPTGQFIEASIKLVGETDMQKVGSAVTYARRYTLGALLSMKAVDDDAALASGKVLTVNNTNMSGTSVKVNASNSTPTASQEVAKAKPSFRRPTKVEKPVSISTQPSEDDL